MADRFAEKTLRVGGKTIRLTLPESAPETIIYLHGGEEESPAIAAVAAAGAAIAVIADVDWDAELSPWPAPRAFARGEDFSGRAGEYLGTLTEEIIPAVEAELPAPPRHRAIAGYSLAGLFAVYAGWSCAAFDRIASMSGSLWYDGFLDWLRTQPPVRLPERCYLSLGDREGAARNPRLAAVEPCTRALLELLRERGVEATFEMHPGGHFRDVPMRVERGLLALV